jgi:hypothetical protein
VKLTAFWGALVLCPFAFGQAQTPPPEPPKPAPAKSQAGQSTFEETESIWSIAPFYWLPKGDARLAGGRISPDPPAQTIDLGTRLKNAPGLIITAPTGRSNRLEFTFWEAKGSGSQIAARDYFLFGDSYDKGEQLDTEYRIRSGKVTWNYLSFPYPALDSKFRIKTLWEFQYAQVNPTITAPFTATPAQGGAAAVPAQRTTGKRTVLLPTLGLGM